MSKNEIMNWARESFKEGCRIKGALQRTKMTYEEGKEMQKLRQEAFDKSEFGRNLLEAMEKKDK